MNSPNPSEVIQFACSQCQRRLSIPAESAGAQAKCPQCGHVQTAPQVSDTPSPPEAATDGPSSSAGASTPPVTNPSAFGGETGADSSGNTSGFGPVSGASPTPTPQPNSALDSKPPTPLSETPTAPEQPNVLAKAADSPGSFHTAGPAADTETRRLYERVSEQISKLYVGQEELVLGTLVALFSAGHVLIESVPGLGKTLFVRALGRVLGCDFGRIQFTADLMPSDITGAPLFDMKTQEFRFRPGPVFTQFLLADEINRSPAKTHAALLEIMQEYRVTIDGVSHEIPLPFLVMATQNPIESEGTYNLPEAQLDRFMFKLVVEYPQELEEAEILKLHSRQIDLNKRLEEELDSVATPEEIVRITRENANVRIEDRLIEYINKIVRRTRQWPQFHMGASPRAGIALMQAARTLASFNGRDYAVPDDVVRIALPALRHRVILTAEAEVEGQSVDGLLSELIRSVEVPRL